ncbi:ATP-binding protein [Streptomyces sp. 549]|uniref:ATP-binding protein n=1 Tax=Streptomyces sp. 549 TaxID=3049076 RepID=UPI0024C29AA2|nr:ATP-binding protein [Streptomyces sp. 549]MDK1476253.1 ATP-binding protein [Streptomyces sp. 549]
MSFTRRIAKSALLTAAGAASVVGAAAGSAQAVDLPSVPDLGGVSNLDSDNLSSGLDGATQNVTSLAGEAGSDAVKTAVPAAGQVAGTLSRSATPMVRKAAIQAAAGPTDTLGKALQSAKGGLPTDALTESGLPTDALPLGNGSFGGGSIGGIPLGG